MRPSGPQDYPRKLAEGGGLDPHALAGTSGFRDRAGLLSGSPSVADIEQGSSTVQGATEVAFPLPKRSIRALQRRCRFWTPRGDSNSLPPRSEHGALSHELRGELRVELGQALDREHLAVVIGDSWAERRPVERLEQRGQQVVVVGRGRVDEYDREVDRPLDRREHADLVERLAQHLAIRLDDLEVLATVRRAED